MKLAETLAGHICTNLGSHPARVLVAICGWADTGKSTLAKNISEVLKTLGVDASSISTDAFMKDRAERNALGITGYNDLSLDTALLASAIDQYVDGKSFSYCPYDNKLGRKLENPSILTPGRVLIVEGIHALHPCIEKRFLLKVFIDSDESTLRQMRQRANVLKRGMNPIDAAAGIQREWDDFSALVLPQKQFANFVVNVSDGYGYSNAFQYVRSATPDHELAKWSPP